MGAFHSVLIFIQLSYLFFYFRFQHILLENLTLFPLYICVFLNFILLILFIFTGLQNKISKTVIGSIYLTYISTLCYLYFYFFTFNSTDNVEYILFFLSIIYFLYYIFDIDKKSLLLAHYLILFLIYMESFLDRLDNYIILHDNILFFYTYFDNVYINQNLYSFLSNFNSNFIFYAIFFSQFLFLFYFFIKNILFKDVLIISLIIFHIFLMILFNNVFYNIVIIYLLISIFISNKLNIDLKYLFNKELNIIFIFLFSIFLFSNIMYFYNKYSLDNFSNNSSLSSLNFEKHKKFITFSDKILPLSKFNYFQVKSLYFYNKGIFSSRYLKVYWKNKKIFSTLDKYNDSFVNISLYDNLLISTFNNLYKRNDPHCNVIFKYFFKDILDEIIIEQGYIYLSNINDKYPQLIKVRTIKDLSIDIDLNKDFFSYIIKDNYNNSKFIYIN